MKIQILGYSNLANYPVFCSWWSPLRSVTFFRISSFANAILSGRICLSFHLPTPFLIAAESAFSPPLCIPSTVMTTVWKRTCECTIFDVVILEPRSRNLCSTSRKRTCWCGGSYCPRPWTRQQQSQQQQQSLQQQHMDRRGEEDLDCFLSPKDYFEDSIVEMYWHFSHWYYLFLIVVPEFVEDHKWWSLRSRARIILEVDVSVFEPWALQRWWNSKTLAMVKIYSVPRQPSR